MSYDAQEYAEAKMEHDTLCNAIYQHGHDWKPERLEEAAERLGKALLKMEAAKKSMIHEAGIVHMVGEIFGEND